MRLMCLLGTFASLTTSMLPIMRPESPRVFTSLARNNARNLPPLVKLAAAALHLLINSYHLYAISFCVCFVFLFAHDISHVIHQLSPHGEKQRNYERDFGRFVNNFRALAVLQTGFAGIYSHWVSVSELLGIILIILNIYQAVVTGSFRALMMALGIGVAFSGFLKQLAQPYEASREALLSWERELHRVPKWGKAFHRSCRPIAVPVGTFFFVDKGLTLTVLSIVVNNSASLVLAYRQ